MRRTLATAVLCACLGSGAAALAQSPGTPEEARLAFEEGVELEKKGLFDEALERFRRAAEVKTTAGVLFHEAYCLEMSGRLAQALDVYEAAETMAHDEDKRELVKAVEARTAPLAARVPRLVLHVEPGDASVTVDGVTRTGGETLRLDPGPHTIVARREGYVPQELHVTVKERGSEERTLTLGRAAAAPPPAARATAELPDAPPAARSSATLPLLAAGGAVLLAAGGTAAYFLAESAQTDAEHDCPTKLSCESERDTVRTLDAFALVGFVSAAGLGALAIVLFSSGHTRVTTSATSIQIQGAF